MTGIQDLFRKEMTRKEFVTTLGFGLVSDFMKNLNESAYFSEVELKNTQQNREEAGSEKVNFELEAKRR